MFNFTSVASLLAPKQTGTPKRPVAGVYNQITVKMTARLLLRVVVDEKLTAAVEEIFQVFESTIAKYEEEALSLHQEIERLRRLLEERVSNHQTGLCVVSHYATAVCLNVCSYRGFSVSSVTNRRFVTLLLRHICFYC